ncbi:MAG: ABC transporter ATP-binding protein [Candidatus Faecivicinus sp.]|nr:ABC transporter ATP-binding protein [Candidatus Faecivicinus sp.]
MKRKNNRAFRPDRIGDYFWLEWLSLLLITISGLMYNVGLLAGPWFEGRLAQCLADILGGSRTADAMAVLVAAYIAVTLLVQAARFVKRFYVRRFANDINRRMKGVLYANLIRRSRGELAGEGAGALMTKAISDVDDCAEGVRKFTTEVFDTGVALVGYAVMLLVYDWRLALLCLIFPPISFYCAEKMKRPVQRAGAEYKKAASRLSAATLDRAKNAVTYRIYGCEDAREALYEGALADYESTAVRANVWQSALPPIYLVISNVSVLFILIFGAKNVLGTGWRAWDVAAFTTFLSCFVKMATKSSKAAKLFNAVQRAEVSWKRIQPMMKQPEPLAPIELSAPQTLKMQNLSFAYDGGAPIFEGLNLTAQPGDIIGITGPVACGKSTLGRALLNENAYGGSIQLGGRELSSIAPREIASAIGYLGHDPELFSDTVENNVLCGQPGDAMRFLSMVELDGEVRAMENGLNTAVGSGGVRLSGGQAQRLALARTLAHPRPVLVLDDPFSALDRNTEDAVFRALKAYAQDKIVLLISHRLYHFPKLSRIVYMEDGRAAVGAHEEMLKSSAGYRALYESQADQSGEQEAQ